MNDDHFCCNGQCHQGRQCPRYREPRWERMVERFLSLLVILLFLCVLAGYLYASWGMR